MCKLKYLLMLVTGFFAGQLAAQALVATTLRNGSAPGGEILVLVAIPMLIWCGYAFGHDNQMVAMYRRGYAHGVRDQQGESEVSND